MACHFDTDFIVIVSVSVLRTISDLMALTVTQPAPQQRLALTAPLPLHIGNHKVLPIVCLKQVHVGFLLLAVSRDNTLTVWELHLFSILVGAGPIFIGGRQVERHPPIGVC